MNDSYAVEIRAMLPTSVSSYMDTHMNTIPRTITHVLWTMFACNIMLFMSSFSIIGLPNIGFNSFLTALFSCTHNVVIWAALSGRMPPRFSFLAKSPFALGAHFGITIGIAMILSVLSRYFGQLSKCEPIDVYVRQYACQSIGGMMSYSIFAFLLYWLNLLLALLILRGKDDLEGEMEENYQYVEIETPMSGGS
mmetsp:Transcript_9116/g.13304  ORF Transcript_9116/g.13304 Transcript_9116/m.13304 type:complete len:194 (-) Transcript_9116:488-1069(-)